MKSTSDTRKSGQDRLLGIARLIEQRVDERLTLATLARHVGMSPARLQKAFKARFGLSPKAFQSGLRLGNLKSRLREGEEVADAVFAAGFGSASRVYESAGDKLGMTPAAYRKGGQGECIAYAYRETALGPLLMAATERGICFVQFGPHQDALVEQLRGEFPQAELQPGVSDSQALDAWVAALDAHLTEHDDAPKLPLDLRGTAFQLRVWRFLLSVATGTTVTYSEVAEGIGKPRAVRAAASACAANRIAVLVPCHRVIRGDGGLGGYRWGEARKRALLEYERR